MYVYKNYNTNNKNNSCIYTCNFNLTTKLINNNYYTYITLIKQVTIKQV